MTKPTKTVKQVKAEFAEAGISVAGWARAHGFDRLVVFDLLRGRSKGTRGESHRAAVALGLKVGRVIDVRNFKPPPQPERRALLRGTNKRGDAAA